MCMMYDDVCMSIALALGKDICPVFAAWTLRYRFCQMSRVHVLFQKVGRYRNSKPAFGDQKKFQKSYKSENFRFRIQKLAASGIINLSWPIQN